MNDSCVNLWSSADRTGCARPWMPNCWPAARTLRKAMSIDNPFTPRPAKTRPQDGQSHPQPTRPPPNVVKIVHGPSNSEPTSKYGQIFEAFDDDDPVTPIPNAMITVDTSADPKPATTLNDETEDEGTLIDPHTGEPVEPVPPLRLRAHYWGSLCMSMLLEPENEAKILESHHTTKEEVFELLENNKQFQIALREAKSRIAAHGPNAGFVLRSQALAEEFLPQMFKMVMDKSTPHPIRLRAIEDLVAWGRLDPKQDKDKTAEVNTGVHFTMNFIDGRPDSVRRRQFQQIVDVEPTREDK